MRCLCSLLIVCFSVGGCFAPEEKLTVGDLTLVDSFYRMEREKLEARLQDSCRVYRDLTWQNLVDSIRVERNREIEFLIDEQ